jgi:hypothetical protein
VGGQRHAPAALPPGATRYPLYRRMGGPVWTGAEILAGIRSPDRPARSKSLFELSYLGSRWIDNPPNSPLITPIKYTILIAYSYSVSPTCWCYTIIRENFCDLYLKTRRFSLTMANNSGTYRRKTGNVFNK